MSMDNEIQDLQSVNAWLRGAILTAAKRADTSVQQKLDLIASEQLYPTGSAITGNLLKRADLLIRAGIAKREEFEFPFS